MEKVELLTRGGIYLAKLNPVKKSEIGKVRPVVLLTSQIILNKHPPTIFVCPLSSKSYPEYSALHVMLPPRDNLKVISFAVVEHSKSISLSRLIHPRLGQTTSQEIGLILHRLQKMLGI